MNTGPELSGFKYLVIEYSEFGVETNYWYWSRYFWSRESYFSCHQLKNKSIGPHTTSSAFLSSDQKKATGCIHRNIFLSLYILTLTRSKPISSVSYLTAWFLLFIYKIDIICASYNYFNDWIKDLIKVVENKKCLIKMAQQY